MAIPLSFAQFLGFAVVFLVHFLVPIPALSQSAEPTAVRDFYSTPGLNPFEERENGSFNESISPFNGILQLSYTDIVLPGNGGMDIQVMRRYQSSVEDRNIKQVYGYGWEISFGELRFPVTALMDDANCTTGAGLFDTRNNPVFITPDGSSEMMVENDAVMSAATNAILVSKGRYMLACEPQQPPATGNIWVVYSPGGIRFELGFSSQVIDASERFKLYVTRVSDPNGNEILIDYAINAFYTVYITRVYDPLDGRSLDFSYLDESTNNIRLHEIDSGSQVWSYEYEGIVEYNDAIGALDGFLSYLDFDNYHLTRVVRPDGREWTYEYNTEELVPGTTGVYQNWAHLVREVNYPYGGRNTYTYQDVFFGASSVFYAKPNQVIRTRTIETSSFDRISSIGALASSDNNTWTYSFNPGQGTLEDEDIPIGDLTVVQTPVSIERYLHFGYEHTQEEDIWRIGLLVSKSIRDESGVSLYIEQNTWAPQVVSTEPYWNGRNPNFLDTYTNAPLLVSQLIAQHGLLYNTDYSNHDVFGNPVDISRGGSSVTDSIDTTYSYFIDPDFWIVNRPETETTVDVGTITRRYDPANGNLLQVNNYGVVTSYTYTGEGDLSTETDANNNVTVYSDYYRGVPRRVEYPESKVVTRVVNSTGTVASETSGRGFTTTYGYDVIDRLITIDYPLHADVSVSYGSSNDRLIRTLTRGSYQEVTRFNNLMSPVEIEKQDLSTGIKITTVNEFDILGRQTFVSKPSYDSYPLDLNQSQRDQYGVTTRLDPLGRELEVRNPDGSLRSTDYHNYRGIAAQPEAGSVVITDERNNVTINRFYGYGSPDDNRLYRIEAPENMTTTANYDKLGNTIRIWQGEDGGSGHERLYNFDSRFFLVSEDHPEIGHVVIGRDAVGNMVSRQIKNSDVAASSLPDSGITTYLYDGLNRLTKIDYPGGTPDVSYSYDADDNVKTVDNYDSTRSYQYDANGNLISEEITIDTESYSLGYGYNDLDFLDTIIYPSRRLVTYVNDAFGRPTRVANYVDRVSYFPGGQKETVTYVNGMSTSFELNNREWVSSIKVDSSNDGNVIGLSYLYDGRGNVLDIIDGSGINTRTMSYDGLDRLISADGMWGSGTFAYDHEDNMTARTVGSIADEYIVAGNKMLQLRRNGIEYITPAYDVYANQLQTATRDLLFDDASNLIRAQKVSGLAVPDVFFNYDGNNRRVAKIIGQINPEIKHYVYSKGDVVFAEIDFAAATSKENVYLGSQIVASTRFDSSNPVALISAPVSALEKVMITLDGTGSFDPDGTIDEYQWTQQSGTPVTLVDLGSGMAQFESPIVVQNEKLVFELRVRDNDFNTGSTVASVDILQTDTDADGLSDIWEAIYFPGDLNQLGGANADTDNDGFSDTDEFQNGTHPVQFDRLEAPGGILATTGINSLELVWPSVQRATRYAVYSSNTPVVDITDSNRTYTSSSPFLQDDLNGGQHLYYVIVAERLDTNGKWLGDSSPSKVVNVKVGWDIWPQRIIHSTQYADNTNLEIDDQGDVAASWEILDLGGSEGLNPVSYSNYTQQTGWSPATNTAPEKSLNGPSTRVIQKVDGIYAEYYEIGIGWTDEEVIQAGAANEWVLSAWGFNSQGEGLVVTRRATGEQEIMSLRYLPQSGWATPQEVPVNIPTGGDLLPGSLFFADSGAGQLLLTEVDAASVVTMGAISFDPVIGWNGQVSLGLAGIIRAKGSESGHVHVLSVNGDPENQFSNFYTITSNHYVPQVGWSGVLDVVSTPKKLDNASLGFSNIIDFDINNQGQAVIAVFEKSDTAFTVVKFSTTGSWQAEEKRPFPASCEFDDYPDNIDEIFGDDSIPARINLPTQPYAQVNLAIDDYGDWSVVSSVKGYGSSKFNMLVASRYEQGVGWLDDEILHCPYVFWGGGSAINHVSQAMNSRGTTFVMWRYADDGEVLGDTKVLSNKFELLKGEPPVADAGSTQMVVEGDEVILDASLSSDPDNEIVTYQWAQISGTPVNIANGDMAIATFIAPLVAVDETASFELTVTDDLGNQDTEVVDVTVTDFSSTELGVVLSSNGAGPITVGESLTLRAQASGGIVGDYEYQFRYKSLEDASSSWVVLKDFDSVNTVDWNTSGLGGKYRLQARVKEVSNEAITARDSITIWVNSVAPLSGVTLASDAIGPRLEGTDLGLAASTSMQAGSVEYRFELKNTDIQPGWIVIRDYEASGNFVWNTAGYRGKNKIRVYARKAGTMDLAVTDSVTTWVNAPDAVTSILISPSLFSPQQAGTNVIFDASITGGNGDVEYRFSVKDTGRIDEWVVQQNWSTLASFNWDTTGIYGKQRVRVETRNVGSADRELSDRISYWLNDSNPLVEVDLQFDQPALIVTGSPINMTAVPIGISNLYEYQFLVKGAAPDTRWAVLRDFDADPTFQVASSSYPGKTRYQVRARNQGTSDKEVKDTRSIWVNQQDAITDVVMTGSNTSALWGEYVTFNLSFTGGDGDYYLSRELKKPGEEFVENGYFSLQNADSFEFYVGGMMPGTYRMRVKVINSRTDKPVKSNSVKFKVFENSDLAWQESGDNFDQIQTCTVYECACVVFNSCDVDTTDPDIVFGGGY